MKNSVCVVSLVGMAVAYSPAASAKEICGAIAAKYREAHPASTSPYPRDALIVLSASPSSGVERAPALIENVDAGRLTEWARKQTPPLSIAKELLDAVENNTDARQDLEQLPGTQVYVVNGTAGTASCYQAGVYFQVDGREAKRADGPASWQEEGSGCMVIRSFGSVDGVPAAFEENRNLEDGGYSVSVAPWTGSGFGQACTATFRFEGENELIDVAIE
jgi:hypothetical protein